jgi:hypothetical protein
MSQALLARLACIAWMLGYLPVPVISRLLKLRPPITRGSFGWLVVAVTAAVGAMQRTYRAVMTDRPGSP